MKKLGNDSRYVLTSRGYSIPFKIALKTPTPVEPVRKKIMRGGVLASWGKLEGITIACRNCGEDFASFGLRCCSLACEAELTGRKPRVVADNIVAVAPDEDRRRCGCCGKPMLGTASRLYCSPRCRQKAHRRSKRIAA
jgi:hypothetical protein